MILINKIESLFVSLRSQLTENKIEPKNLDDLYSSFKKLEKETQELLEHVEEKPIVDPVEDRNGVLKNYKDWMEYEKKKRAALDEDEFENLF